MSRQLTSKSNLEQLKKEAKRWLKELRADQAEARVRLKRVNPKAPASPGLREVQHALALEYGFVSWAALKERLDDFAVAKLSHAEKVAEFLEMASLNYGVRPGSTTWDPGFGDSPALRQRAAIILARHPEVGSDSIHTAVVCGDLAAVQRRLAERPEAGSERGGPHSWPPLLYLCFGRLPIEAAGSNAVMIAQLLLDRGADPNVSFTDGQNHFTPLTGVMGEGEGSIAARPPHPAAKEIAQLLLDGGANPVDSQGLYNTSLREDDVYWLGLLFSHAVKSREQIGPSDRGSVEQDLTKQFGMDYLLGNAVVRNHYLRAEWLLAHGAQATTPHFYSRRGLYEEAALRGFTRMEELLQRAGVDKPVLTGRELFQVACMRLDREASLRLLAENPEYLNFPGPMMAAAEYDRVEVVEFLLDLGMSPDVEDRMHQGGRALHIAAANDSRRVAAMLIERGAEIDYREPRYGSTPLSSVVFYWDRPHMVELLSPVSRDVFSLAATGNLERLCEVLKDEPELARETRWGVTPLFRLPPAEDSAAEIVELLLECGADPTFRNRDGQTAADCAAEAGLDEAAELILSKLE
jgi:uncharacterized protein